MTMRRPSSFSMRPPLAQNFDERHESRALLAICPGSRESLVMSPSPSRTSRLRSLLAEPGLRLMPCAFDALSARLIEDAGFSLSFMSGFGVSAARLAQPDTGLISYAEMLDQGRNVCAATRSTAAAAGNRTSGA